MLSRVADACFWIGRYLERAENVARFADVNQYLLVDLPGERGEQWEPLVQITGDEAFYTANYGEATRENVLRFLTFDPLYLNSIASCVQQARENARAIRDTITVELWEHINHFHDMMGDGAARYGAGDVPYEFFARVKNAGQLFSGLLDSAMTHGEPWHFIRLGQFIERAEKTTRLLDVKYFILLPSAEYVGSTLDELHWVAVLRSASALQMYRKQYGLIRPDRIIDFLLFDRTFPRSVLFCLLGAQRCLHAISGTPLGAYGNEPEQRLGQLTSTMSYLNAAEIIRAGMHEYLDDLQERINEAGHSIHDFYFAIKPSLPDHRLAFPEQ
jgi:uncharacterized alpha-E superfamily protein